MHVLIISDERWDSGLSRYALDAAAALKARSHHVHFWALAGKPPYEAAVQAGLKVLDCSRPWTRLAQLRRYLVEHDIEIINPHTGSAHSLAVFLSRTLASRPPVVRTRADARPPRRRPFGRWLRKRTAAHICANHRLMKELQADLHGLKTPAAVIPPGIDVAAFQAHPLPGRASVGIVGRLDPVKGHDDFLKAAALVKRRLPQAEFWVAGREENVKIADLQRQAQELGLGPEVHLLGHVERVDRLMTVCQVGVVASKGSEAVSRVALEWMASGRPLVATEVGDLPELVEAPVTGLLVPPGRPDLLAERILDVLADPEQARKMGDWARERAEREFSLGAFGRRTEAFLESVLDGTAGESDE